MVAYENLATCRMEFLTQALDDPAAAPCGRCDRCAGPWYATDVDGAEVARAQASLAHAGVPVEPRALWPTGLDRLGITVDGAAPKARIAAGEQVAEGRVVARLTDLGWGAALRQLFAPDAAGRPVDAVVPPGLAQAALRVLAEWDWERRPVAVTYLPSLSRPRLVADLAAGVARAGRLELLAPLELAPGVTGGRRSANSAYRVRDVWGRFLVPPALADRLAGLDGPVLLVDDYIDSRWTMTVAGRLLRLAGASAVLPFALAAVAG